MKPDEPREFSLFPHEHWLGNTPALHGLPGGLIRHIAAHVTERRLRDREILFFQRDPGDFSAIVRDGAIHQILHGPDGRELIVSAHHAGQVVDDTVLLEPHPRQTTACASGMTRVLTLNRRHFPTLLDEPAFLRRLLERLCERLRQKNAYIETTCLYPLEARLARHLLTRLRHSGHHGELRVQLPANQGLLAAMINVSRPKMNARLQHWKRRGIVRIRHNHLYIDDLSELQRIAGLSPGHHELSPR